MEGEKKEMEKKEAGQVDPADAEQDKNLIAQMIKKHLGKDEASDEEMEMANHAVEAYQADGMEKQEAVEAAGKHLKMALAIGQKMSAKKEGATEEAKTESTEKKEETQEASEKKEDDKKEEHKESERVIKLTAENARLREALKAFELGDYLEKKLIGSKKPVPVTKKFREALGALKSKEQIDSSYQLFFAAYDAKSEDAEESSGFVFTEKNTQRQSKQTTESGSGFADCLSK